MLVATKQQKGVIAKMRKLFVGSLAALAAVVVGTQGVCAADATLDVPVSSAYVWRGMVLNADPVLQPSLTVADKRGLSLNVWANMDLTRNRQILRKQRATDPGNFSEVDLTVAYKLPVKAADVHVGLIRSLFPSTSSSDLADSSMGAGAEGSTKIGRDTTEAFVSIAFPDYILEPKLQINYDFDKANGAYVNFSLRKGWDIADNFNVGLGAAIGAGTPNYNNYRYGVEASDSENGKETTNNNFALNDGTLTADATYKLAKDLSLGASVQYAILLDDDIKAGANNHPSYFNNSDDGIVVGTLRMTYSF